MRRKQLIVGTCALAVTVAIASASLETKAIGNFNLPAAGASVALGEGTSYSEVEETIGSFVDETLMTTSPLGVGTIKLQNIVVSVTPIRATKTEVAQTEILRAPEVITTPHVVGVTATSQPSSEAVILPKTQIAEAASVISDIIPDKTLLSQVAATDNTVTSVQGTDATTLPIDLAVSSEGNVGISPIKAEAVSETPTETQIVENVASPVTQIVPISASTVEEVKATLSDTSNATEATVPVMDASGMVAQSAGLDNTNSVSQNNATQPVAEQTANSVSTQNELVVPGEGVSVEVPEEKSEFEDLVIAQVNDYVNVRAEANTESEIVGKLYDDSVGTLVSEEDGWYQIHSGNVIGYVKAEYCVTGEEAIALVDEVGTRIAKVTTTTLKIREEASLESAVLGLIPIDEELIVTEEVEGWVKVSIEEGDGYVSTDYVTLRTEFVQAESKAEEEARLAKEAEARRAAQAAAAAAAPSHAATSSTTAIPTISGGSEMGTAVAQYACGFVGNPYVYGGSSLTNGTDCSGFVMSVYSNFGVSLPHSSTSDRSQGYAVDGLANAQPGDLVCYSGHVALYIGNNQIVHASSKRTGIIISNADYKTVLAVRRIF